MKNSIKREKSQARLSYSERENVRATLKTTRKKFNLILALVMMLTMAQSAWADDVVNYEVITEVPIVDDGQKTNWNSSEDYGSLVDGKTGTKYGISNAEPWVEFHYSRAFVPKRYIIWTANDTNGGRNPITYTIKAKLNKTDDWTTIVDNASGSELPKANNTKKEFGIEDNNKAYKYYRFEATKGNSGFQLAELQFMEVANKKTVTWKMEGGLSQDAGLSETDNTFCSIDNDKKTADLTTDSHAITMRYSWKSGEGLKWRNTISPNYASQGRATFDHPKTNGCVVTFPNLKGTVTSLKMTRLIFKHQKEFSYKIKMYVGTKKGDNITLLTINDNEFLESNGDGVPFTATFNGGVEVDENAPLTIWFDGEELEDGGAYNYSFHGSTSSSLREKSTLSITYVPEEEPDAGHVFTSANISASGNVLTAICSSTDDSHNTLYGGANHRYTLKLNADDDVYNIKVAHSATFTPSLTDFNADTQLNATCSFNYHNNDTGEDGTTPPRNVGKYTVTATVKINGTNYPLTKSFNIWDAYRVNSNYTQFSFSPSMVKQGALMTITFTPQLGETVKTLALTGENTGENINFTDNHDGTYTFTMPAENVNLSASFEFPTNANFEQNGNTYTIKNADGWNYFCQRMENDATLDGFSGKTIELSDDITVTTMAGSINQKFKGTFDGKGRTLTFNCTATGPNTAPFYITDGATIRNLHATGLIEGGIYNYMGGLVGEAMGNLTIENCWVSTQISTTYSYNYNVGHGGIVGYLDSGYNQCHITGCVFDGLIYNPENSGITYGCGGFIGAMAQYGYAILKDCLFLHGQYDNNNGKCELKWGSNDQNSTFFHRSNNYGEGKLTNCFYVETRGLKQGSPAEVSTVKPTNFDHFGTPTTDYGFMKVYGHTMVFGGKYYTPKYGDLVEEYDYSGVKYYTIEYDGMPLGIPDITSQLWTESLRYNRSFTKDKPVTMMLPFNFKKDRITLANSSENPSGKFYSFAGVNGSEPVMESTNEVTEMKANTPYIYVPGEDTDYWDIYVGGYGINIFTEGYDGGNREAAYDNLKLVGTYNIKTWDAPEVGTFILNYNGELEQVTDGTMVKPTSAYVTERRFMELANSADNSYAIELADHIGGVYEAVKLADRTLYKDGDWNTLTLPFALSATEIAASPLAGATIMTLNGTTSNLDGEGLLTLNFETAYDPTIAPSGSIVAGRPYIVKWKPQADLFINSADDWNDFCTRVSNGTESYSGKTVRLTSNISVTKMAGTHSNPFRGTFEGDGYTIEVTLDNNGDTGTNDESYGVAPFRFTSGATIRNLHVGGTITTSTRKYAGGIVGKTVSGTNNIQNCWVSAEIYSTINGDGTHGGFVGKASGTVNISNCLFDGVLTTDKVNITHSCGGFVGWRDGALSIDHSMYAPAKLPDGKYTIGSNNTCTLTRNNSSSYSAANCLYTQALGTEQGTNASAMSNDDKLDKLGSGWIISNNHVVPKMEVEQMPNIVNPVFSNVTVEDPASTVVSFNGGEFVGNFAPLEITDANRKSIVLLAAGNKLGYAKTDRTIANGKALGACRAYFHIPSISGNAQTARSFVLNFGEENVTTGIIEVNTNTTNKSEGAFNLQGRRIVNPKKGLYIVNGKKIIIK